jgi:hypothetical protein
MVDIKGQVDSMVEAASVSLDLALAIYMPTLGRM